MTGTIKKIYKWIIGILAAIGAFFVLLHRRGSSAIIEEAKIVSADAKVEKLELVKAQEERAEKIEEIDKEIKETKKKAKDALARLEDILKGEL